MMRNYILLLSLFLVSGVATAQKKSSTQIEFTSRKHNFGQIKEVDGAVTCLFEFKNISDKPFVINYVIASCGCTTPQYDKAPLMPGKKGTITVRFNPEGRPGVFNKEIIVTSSNVQNEDVLTIEGTVVPRPRRPEDDFPLLYLDGIRLSASSINLGNIAKGYTHTGFLYLYNSSEKPVKITVTAQQKLSKYASFEYKDTLIAPKERGKISFTYDLKNADRYDVLNDRLEIHVNGQPLQTTIRVQGISIPDFSKVEKNEQTPHIEISELYHNMGTLTTGTAARHTLQIRNIGLRDLVIENIVSHDKHTSYQLTKKIIPPGESTDLTLTLTPGATKGQVTHKLTVISNDLYDPAVDISLRGEIK